MKIPWVALQVGTSLVTMARKNIFVAQNCSESCQLATNRFAKKFEKSIDDWLNYHTYNDTAWSVLPLISQFFFGNQIVIYGNHFADEGRQKVTFRKRDLGALSDYMFSKNVNKVPFPGPWMP